MPKKLANELWLNMVVQTRLFKQIKDSQKAQPGTLYFHNYVAQVVPININNFDWYTLVDFEVHANDCKQVGSGCTFKVRVNVDVSIDNVRLPFKLDLLENVRIVDDITFVEGNGHLIVGQLLLQGLWSSTDFTPPYDIKAVDTGHQCLWGATTRNDNDKKFYVMIKIPYDSAATSYTWKLTFSTLDKTYNIQPNALGIAVWIPDKIKPHQRYIYTHLNYGNGNLNQFLFIKCFGWYNGQVASMQHHNIIRLHIFYKHRLVLRFMLSKKEKILTISLLILEIYGAVLLLMELLI